MSTSTGKEASNRAVSDVGGPLRLVLVGWLSVLLFAIAVVVARGVGELGAMAVFAAVAIAMGSWVWRRRSRASLITSLVLGVLHAVEQVAYSVAEATSDPFDPAIFVIDVVAFVGAVLIVAGAAAALVRRRRQGDPAGGRPA